MVARVAWISIAPVKKLAMQQLDEVRLEQLGVRENRRFHLIDSNGLLVRNTAHGALVPVASTWDEATGRLELRFPDGEVVEGTVVLGEAVTTDFYGRAVAGHLVVGHWAAALSQLVDAELRLVQVDEIGSGIDRPSGSVTLVSRESVEAFGAAAGVPGLDERRFRMLFGVEGVSPYEEEAWLGRPVQLGTSVIVPRGNVGRCHAITRNPDTGDSDFQGLKTLVEHRRGVETSEPMPFGVWGEVVRAGVVRLGDVVTVADDEQPAAARLLVEA
jgi:uncharacterized protein YcbX